ncbi:MAG: hypothetical protein MJE68_20950 [Proteobacteria bacterium]|nr:hypothetical protein [Pseudomonadota bacterium]
MTYTFRQGDLPKLDLQVDRGTDFKAWKSQWDAYLSLSGLEKQSQTKQVQALTLCFSRETVTIVDNLGLTATQKGDAKQIVTAIQHTIRRRPYQRIGRMPKLSTTRPATWRIVRRFSGGPPRAGQNM